MGHAYVDGVHANREMVARGAAWVYRQYNSDQSLIDLEQSAKAARLGLWGLSEAEVIPPWEWRKAGKTTTGHLRVAF
nr:thermonuclease family protein [Pseudomonas sp. 2FE]